MTQPLYFQSSPVSIYVMYTCTYILYVTIRHSIRENMYIEMNASPGKILIPSSR